MTINKENGLSLRIAEDNPNHHLYRNNGGFWWLHYTAHPTRITAERKRCSLATRSLVIARERRDAIFAHLDFEGGE